ncbi:MAG: DUF502 domain-containing protein [Phycisphaerales bacterium]|nr:DUF502 domain-containing protein [Phycisphaerae bacterium]NNF44411.1 DUF502 domain-containing protein [Phycisphaerales bacterium]NNM25819.1 DUF502 domain-containing protein [Phycisphaerales bacterium]
MSDPSARTFTGDFRRFFLRGLVVLLPSVLTLWIVVKAYQFVDKSIAEPINRGVRIAMVNTARVWSPMREMFDPTLEEVDGEIDAIVAAGKRAPERTAVVSRIRADKINAWWIEHHWYMDLIGLVVAIIIVYVAGRLLGGFFGRRIYRKLEQLITTVPVFKQVYPYVKQIVDFLFSDDQPIKFNRVVAVEYPRKGIWSVGFQTGATLRSLQERAGEAVTVFIPSSPTPFTGYTITVHRDDVIELPMSVEEAIRFAVSGGVLVPTHQEASWSPSSDAIPTGLVPLPGSVEKPPPGADSPSSVG